MNPKVWTNPETGYTFIEAAGPRGTAVEVFSETEFRHWWQAGKAMRMFQSLQARAMHNVGLLSDGTELPGGGQ